MFFLLFLFVLRVHSFLICATRTQNIRLASLVPDGVDVARETGTLVAGLWSCGKKYFAYTFCNTL